MYTHKFESHLSWSSIDDIQMPRSGRQIKNHTVQIDGKPILNISAAKVFKGDPNLHNPEDLLLASLSSCHMMSYLYCCSLAKIDVLFYSDHAEAILEVDSNGAGRIIKVVLRPIVRIKDQSLKELAVGLHMKAKELCFIANSCNFSIEHEVLIESEK